MEETKMPEHIAIIMDGNRRWAKEKNLLTAQGHKAGAETLKKITRHANKIGVKYLTVYAFSTENWKRSKDEVSALMVLLGDYLAGILEKNDENMRICFIGDLDGIGEKLLTSIRKVEDKTKGNTGLQLNVALNYGGRDEILKAVQKIAMDVKNSKISGEDITEELLSKYLYTKNMPDPDLVIRTSGEMRTSNFLPWQIVYSEFVFIQKYWPAFEESDLDEVIQIYKSRKRKFGGN